MKLKLTRPIAFFDLETTGVTIGLDRIVEISILKLNPDGSRQIKTKRVNPEMPIPQQSSAVHGIYDKDVADSPTFKQIAGELSSFIDNADLAGYNSNKFDVPILVDEFLRAEISFEMKNRKLVDVQNIFHKMEQRTLAAAYKFYCSKELVNAHSAQADTEATYEILLAQLERYAELTPAVDFLHDFSNVGNNVDLAGRIIRNEKKEAIFNFGKHKGKTVEEVFRIEPSYYDWMMKGDFARETKQVITSLRLKDFNGSK